jgi:S1-C subfamily serine protease
VVVKVDDSAVSTSQEITRALHALGSKKTFTVTVVRNKKEIPLTVTMEERGGAVRSAEPVRECE